MSPATEFVLLIILFLVSWTLWNTILGYPIQMMVTLFHEAGHALATVLTRGKVEGILVAPGLSGVTVSNRGNRLLILNGGYLGSVAFGFLIFWSALTPAGSLALLFAAAALAVVTLAWVKNPFGLAVGLALAGILFACFFSLPAPYSAFLAKFLGLSIVLYAFFTINFVHWCAGRCPDSDPAKLGELTRIPLQIWTMLWKLATLGILVLMFLLAMGVLP